MVSKSTAPYSAQLLALPDGDDAYDKGAETEQ